MPKPMGNFKVLVCSYGDDHLEAAIDLCMDERDTATAYSAQEGKELVLYYFLTSSHETREIPAVPFPFGMDRKTVVAFVKGWLKSLVYEREPDHDGSNTKGFTISNGYTGAGWTQDGVLMVVKPCWAMHGK